MDRQTMVDGVRGLLRLTSVKPFTDVDVLRVIEYGIDDISNRIPFAVAIDRAHGVKGQRGLILPMDVLEIIEAHYMDSAGTTLVGNITAILPANGDDLDVNTDPTEAGFPTAGTILIDDEQITYASLGATSFVNITRGAGGTTAAAHTDGTGIIEPGIKWMRLNPVTVRQLGDADENWLSATDAAPTDFYTFGGVIDFNTAPDKNGYFNFMLMNLIRPPELTADTSVIVGLLTTFHKAIVYYGAAKLAQTLAQDDSSVQQATMWFQEYLSDVARLKERQGLYERGHSSRMTPQINRPTGFA